MKELKLAELKVLLIIIRQTLGWADKRGRSGRKEIDWISSSQLCQKTGCSKRSITSATDVLVRRNLITIFDECNNILNSPEKRQGKTKLYYRLSNPVEYTVENHMKSSSTSAILAEDIIKNTHHFCKKCR
ncbi:MAG: replication protein [Bacteroidetes bacterium]|nr:replication protein [Bacteroidota bacterium]